MNVAVKKVLRKDPNGDGWWIILEKVDYEKLKMVSNVCGWLDQFVEPTHFVASYRILE